MEEQTGFTSERKGACSTRISLVGPLEMGAENEERTQHKVYYTAGDETGGLDLEE